MLKIAIIAFLIYAVVLIIISVLRSPPNQDKADKQLDRVLTAVFGRWQRWLK